VRWHDGEPVGDGFAKGQFDSLKDVVGDMLDRGVAVLPSWAIEKYRADDYIRTRPLGSDGMWSTLYSAVRREQANLPFVQAFTDLARDLTHAQLDGIKPATAEA
jgi:DNA-binding transcriptional LysR family regulator